MGVETLLIIPAASKDLVCWLTPVDYKMTSLNILRLRHAMTTSRPKRPKITQRTNRNKNQVSWSSGQHLHIGMWHQIAPTSCRTVIDVEHRWVGGSAPFFWLRQFHIRTEYFKFIWITFVFDLWPRPVIAMYLSDVSVLAFIYMPFVYISMILQC